MADEEPTRWQRFVDWVHGKPDAKIQVIQPQHYTLPKQAELPSRFEVEELISFTGKCVDFYKQPRGNSIFLDRFKDIKEKGDKFRGLDIPYSAHAIVALAFTEWIGTKDRAKLTDEIRIWNDNLKNYPQKFFRSGVQGSGFFQINERDINRKDAEGNTKKGYEKKNLYEELFNPKIYQALRNYTEKDQKFLRNTPRREVLATAIIASWFEARGERVPTLTELTHPKDERKAIEQSIPFLVATVVIKQEEARLLWNMGKTPPEVRFENLPVPVRMALVYVGHVGGDRIPMITKCRKMKNPEVKDIFQVFDKTESGYGAQLKIRGDVVVNAKQYLAPARFANTANQPKQMANLAFGQQ